MRRIAMIGLLFGASCAAAGEPESTYAVAFMVIADEGVPVAGAEIVAGALRLGTTDARGTLTVELRGREGTTLPIVVGCPDGHRPPEGPNAVRLRSFSALSDRVDARLSVTVRCPPAQRLAALIVRAENAPPGLPVVVEGREVARTDAFGTAHVFLHVAPGERVTAVLDTSDAPDLRPVSPRSVFTMPDTDEIVPFAAAFAPNPARRRSVKRRPARSAEPPPSLPQRIH